MGLRKMLVPHTHNAASNEPQKCHAWRHKRMLLRLLNYSTRILADKSSDCQEQKSWRI